MRVSKQSTLLQSQFQADHQDHDHEPPMTMHRLMSLIAMAFLWTGSQIPVYLFGGVSTVR